MTRACTETIRNGLKTAFKQLVGDLGGVEAAASCTRVGRAQISDYGNVDCEKLPPVDVVLDLECIGGHPHVSAALARAQGFELRALGTRPVHELAESLACLAENAGKLMGQAARTLKAGALNGNVLKPKERGAMMRELDNVAQMAREATLALSRMEGP